VRPQAEPRTLAVLGLLAALKATGLVLLAEALARGITASIGGHESWREAVVLGLFAAVLRGATTWATQVYATVASIGAKERIRHDLAAHLLAGGRDSSGERPAAGSATAIGTLGLDELDDYYRVTIPATVSAAVIPLMVGSRILFADWVSALIIVLTVPLIPVFMILVGKHSEKEADAASATQQRLSDHLLELARGLPVLVGLGRVEEQARALRVINERVRTTTMRTLRTAFLSALVLELISTISVAVVAVFVGVRLIAGDLTLMAGLLALLLAPECFLPFREVGTAFHSSQGGLAALRKARELTEGALPEAGASEPGAARIRLEGITVTREDRALPVLDGLDVVIDRGSVTAVAGSSGAGKSTLLGVIVGVVEPTAGRLTGVDPARVAWVPQHPATVGATVREELALYAGDEHGDAIEHLLADLGLSAIAEADPARISQGELRRVAVARGLLRVLDGADLLVLDEPTAHLDATAQELVERAIAAVPHGVTVVLASHEEAVLRLARQRVVLDGEGGGRLREDATAGEVPAEAETQHGVEADAGSAPAGLLALLTGIGWRSIGAVALGAAAALFAIALTALSGWLIVRASQQPPIMYLMVAIVGVRFFGLGRAALRYAERLATHDTVLRSVTGLRERLWLGLAERGPASRGLTGGAAAIDYLVATADRVRDLVPRVLMPPAVAAVSSAAVIITTAILHPAAVPGLLIAIAVALVGGPAVAAVADRSATAAIARQRSSALREFGKTLLAADDLRANGAAVRRLAALDETDARLGARGRIAASAQGLGSAIVVFALSAAAVLTVQSTAAAVAAGTLSGEILAVLVLLPLGLIEPVLAAVTAVQHWPALRGALRKVDAVSPVGLDHGGRAPGPIESLELNRLRVSWNGEESYGPFDAAARRGDWVVVAGPSGTGKSTMLTTLLGYLPAASGTWQVNGQDARIFDSRALRDRFAWCSQESHLFDSTLRGNLLLARAADDRPSERELREALSSAGLGDLMSSLPAGLDTRVGPAGSRLSGGQRQRLALARTLLTRADVVLLDEPTAHLDAATAELVMASLRVALADRIVVLVTHHPAEVRSGVLASAVPAQATSSSSTAAS
jgi:ATP-binding cassette subfamily C protein CydCD